MDGGELHMPIQNACQTAELERRDGCNMRFSPPSLLRNATIHALRLLGIYDRRTAAYGYIVRRLLSDLETGRILDLGCGGGTFSRMLAQDGRAVVAVDIDRGLLKSMGDPRVSCVQADAQSLPFRKGCIDAVVSLSLLEHLRNPDDCVRELRRVCRADGKVIAQVPNPRWLFEPHSKWPLLFWMREEFQNTIFEHLRIPWVNMKLTVESVQRIFERQGFSLAWRREFHLSEVFRLVASEPPSWFLVFVNNRSAETPSNFPRDIGGTFWP